SDSPRHRRSHRRPSTMAGHAERGTMNVGDRVKWLPTGQEGRIFEVRDGGIVAVRGEDWAVYDYADRFELVNEPVSASGRLRKLVGYMTDGLTFNALRAANMARLPEF